MSERIDVLAVMRDLQYAAYAFRAEDLHRIASSDAFADAICALTGLISAAKKMYEAADVPSEGRFCPNAAAFLKADEICRNALKAVSP